MDIKLCKHCREAKTESISPSTGNSYWYCNPCAVARKRERRRAKASPNSIRLPDGDDGKRNFRTQVFAQEAANSRTDECIEWPFQLSGAGYAVMSIGGKPMQRVHRWVCEQAHGGPPSEAHEAAHGSCHNRACINPRHLSWKTRAENNADRRRDGTDNSGERNGHSKLTAEQVRSIRSSSISSRLVAQEYGVTARTVRDIRSRRSWAWLE